MIRVKLTENYLGFNIQGTFDDFYELYDAICYFIGFEKSEDKTEDDMRVHIFGFLYDLRHAYQGARNVTAVNNDLNEEAKEYFGIDKSVKQDILYDFNYIIPELILDIVLFKHFALKKFKRKLKEYDTNYNIVMAFYSKAIDALKEMLTENRMKRARKIISETVVMEEMWYRQWFTLTAIEYINMTKKQRQKEIIHTIQEICDYYLYDECREMRKKILQYAEENNISEDDVECGRYPDFFEW